MKKNKKEKFSLNVPLGAEYQLRPVRIVADGAVARGDSALGHLIPVLIVDATDRPDIVDIMQAHAVNPSGDVIVRWANPVGFEKDRTGLIHLILHFIRPVDTYVVVKFQKGQAGLVDQIVRVKLVYLQAGAPGDRLANSLDAHRILIEIRNTDFDGTWERMLFETLFNEFRVRGLDRQESADAVRMTISEWRRLGNIRMTRRGKGNERK